FREVIVNLLIHREYQNPSISIFDIRKNYVLIQNANRPLRSGIITLDSYEPHPKNPHIANFFVQIGRAEHLGTGVRNLYHYAPLYFGESPQIEDDNMFSVRFAISSQKQNELLKNEIEHSKGQVINVSKEDIQKTIQRKLELRGVRLTQTQMMIVVAFAQDSSITKERISIKMGLPISSINTGISALKRKGVLNRIGGRKYGEWVLIL
ncbi:MAG: hypothetical protein KBT27_09955, partial [Prevotellaceae bacterium]|nr:hypothetical protein [Candidatus Faecinaster equi]